MNVNVPKGLSYNKRRINQWFPISLLIHGSLQNPKNVGGLHQRGQQNHLKHSGLNSKQERDHISIHRPSLGSFSFLITQLPILMLQLLSWILPFSATNGD